MGLHHHSLTSFLLSPCASGRLPFFVNLIILFEGVSQRLISVSVLKLNFAWDSEFEASDNRLIIFVPFAVGEKA